MNQLYSTKIVIYLLSLVLCVVTISTSFMYSAGYANTNTNTASTLNTTINSDQSLMDYSNCMYQICNQSNGISSCYEQLPETKIVNLSNGFKLQEGVELLRYAKTMCQSKVKDKNNLRLYDNIFKTQTEAAYLDSEYQKMITASESMWSTDKSYASFKACMLPLCNDIDAEEPTYSKCWKTHKTQLIMKQCEDKLSKSKTPYAVKGKFMNEVSDMQAKACLDMAGSAKFDEVKGDCSIELEFRDENENVVAKQYFVMGEIVECSQHFFQTDLGSRKEKKRISGFISGGLKIVYGAIKIGAGVVSLNPGLIIDGAATAVDGGADIAKDAVYNANRQTLAKRGSCWFDGNRFMEEGENFKLRTQSR